MNGSKHILIADDCPLNRNMLHVVLSSERCYEIGQAENGSQALEMMKKTRPDLLILDILMPVLDGWDTLKQLKENDRLKNTPVLICSAGDNSRDKIRAYELGAVGYIAKPVDVFELKKCVNSILCRTNQSLGQSWSYDAAIVDRIS